MSPLGRRRNVVLLLGGPANGGVMTGEFSRSVIATGEQYDHPFEVARYRRTREKVGRATVYKFRGWESVVLSVPAPGANDGPPHG